MAAKTGKPWDLLTYVTRNHSAANQKSQQITPFDRPYYSHQEIYVLSLPTKISLHPTRAASDLTTEYQERLHQFFVLSFLQDVKHVLNSCSLF